MDWWIACIDGVTMRVMKMVVVGDMTCMRMGMGRRRKLFDMMVAAA